MRAVDKTALDKEDVFDRSELLERVGGDEELCAELLDTFVQDILVRLEELKQTWMTILQSQSRGNLSLKSLINGF